MLENIKATGARFASFFVVVLYFLFTYDQNLKFSEEQRMKRKPDP